MCALNFRTYNMYTSSFGNKRSVELGRRFVSVVVVGFFFFLVLFVWSAKLSHEMQPGPKHWTSAIQKCHVFLIFRQTKREREKKNKRTRAISMISSRTWQKCVYPFPFEANELAFWFKTNWNNQFCSDSDLADGVTGSEFLSKTQSELYLPPICNKQTHTWRIGFVYVLGNMCSPGSTCSAQGSSAPRSSCTGLWENDSPCCYGKSLLNPLAKCSCSSSTSELSCYVSSCSSRRKSWSG